MSEIAKEKGISERTLNERRGQTRLRQLRNTVLDNLYQLRGCSKIFYKYKQLQSLKHNIYNANSNQDTYVDTFPKVKYDELFN